MPADNLDLPQPCTCLRNCALEPEPWTYTDGWGAGEKTTAIVAFYKEAARLSRSVPSLSL